MATSLRDPRWFQAATLSALLATNVAVLDLAATVPQSLVTVAAALATQALCCRLARRPFDPLSPLITGLSLSLLLRTGQPVLWAAAPALAIGSKFLLRLNGKHVFNPACFAIVALLGIGAPVWVSPGQWGSGAWLASALLCAGGLVLSRSRRVDTAAAFLGIYAALLLARATWLGDPGTIPLHQMQSGSLLVFAFFMVTDPRTTPDHPAGRLAFAAAVAVLAYVLQFVFQLRTGLFWALAALSLATPLLDLLLPARRHAWHMTEA